jgi:signal transduction histidine kinase
VNATEWWIYLCTAAVLVQLGIHDTILHVRLQNGTASLGDPHLMAFFGPAMLMGAGTALLTRFVRLYRGARRTNAELALELEDHRAEITQQLMRVKALEQQRVVLSERERMMREMHDGVGGHLVAALASMEHASVPVPEANRALRDALDDLRLVVNALEPSTQDLTGLLADMRARLEPRLRSQGLRFRWEVAELPSLSRLGPFDVLQVLRIFQESITNVLKHGRAQSITIRSGRVSPQEQAAYIEIVDDGCGFAPARGTGRGIPSMVARARQIGATLTIVSLGKGTAVRLVIPEEVCA